PMSRTSAENVRDTVDGASFSSCSDDGSLDTSLSWADAGVAVASTATTATASPAAKGRVRAMTDLPRRRTRRRYARGHTGPTRHVGRAEAAHGHVEVPVTRVAWIRPRAVREVPCG